jgi:hypothetical protein
LIWPQVLYFGHVLIPRPRLVAALNRIATPALFQDCGCAALRFNAPGGAPRHAKRALRKFLCPLAI